MVVGNLFEACHFPTLAMLYGLDECRSLEQGIVRAGIEPRETSAHELHFEFSGSQELLIDRRYLQLSSRRRFDGLGDVHHLVGVEIETHHGIIAFGVSRLFLDGGHIAIGIESGYAITLGVAHPVTENGGQPLLGILHGHRKHRRETLSVKNIITQYQTGGVVTNELFANDKGLCQAIG